jgi:asparagine synthase (glutamine-hydrolysing)
MSGIVGVVGVHGETPENSFLQALTHFMAFRGPEAQHTWAGDGIGLGHTLLSASPFREHQPLTLDGKLWIVADARLDARADLLSGLQNAGHPCSGDAGDAELILRAYAAWGQECLDHLLGDFCFAIWDGNHKSLFCAHDQLGIRPFYYAETKSWLVFSNTLDCVRLRPEAAAGVNELSVADFLLFGIVQDPSATMFAGIRRLPPAHMLTWSEGKLCVRRYWTMPEDEEIQYRQSSDYEEHFRHLLYAAVKDRLCPGRVAVAMSGGLDSTSVAAMACRAGCDLRAFTTVYDRVIPHDERYFSQLAAESLGIPIQHLAVDEYVEAVQGEVPGSQSSQPHENVLASFESDFYRLAANASRILLTGQGGDIGLFPSNSHFLCLLRAARLRRFVRDSVAYAIAHRGLPPLGIRTLLRRRFGAPEAWRGDYPVWLNPDLERRLRLRERWQGKQASRWLHRRRSEAVALLSEPLWQAYFESCDPGASRICLQHVHPYFDLRLLRFLFSVPPIPWTLDKGLLRSAMCNILPEAVRLRPKSPLAGDPWLIFTRNNRGAFSKAPLNLAAYVDRDKYQAFLNSPAAWRQDGYQFSVRPAALSAWLSGITASRGN